jgi:hypothetical protein
VSWYLPGGNDSLKRPSLPAVAVNCWPAALRAMTVPGSGSDGGGPDRVGGPPTRTSMPVAVWLSAGWPLQPARINTPATTPAATRQAFFMSAWTPARPAWFHAMWGSGYPQALPGSPPAGLPEGQLICWYPHGTVTDACARLAMVGGSHWMSAEAREPCSPRAAVAHVILTGR